MYISLLQHIYVCFFVLECTNIKQFILDFHMELLFFCGNIYLSIIYSHPISSPAAQSFRVGIFIEYSSVHSYNLSFPYQCQTCEYYEKISGL